MTTQPPPATFEHYEAENPYGLLTRLHDLAMIQDRDDVDQALTVIAMAAAVVHWWGRWQPGMVHRALLSGATVDQVAAAAGQTVAEVHRVWLVWVTGQVDLHGWHRWHRAVTNPDERKPLPDWFRVGVAPAEFEQVEALMVRALSDGVPSALPGGSICN